MSETIPSDPNAPQTAFPIQRASRWPDIVLTVLVLAFAFAAASFPVRNSDYWRHLATGRLLAQGEYTFGADPFAYTTEGRYWANHSWLFDFALFEGYQVLGDTALVVLKALAIVVLAGMMLYISRQEGPFWISAGSVLLALLAMSPRLLLQPACLSILLLAGCLGLLRTGGRAYYAIPAAVALWVNVDDWFLLGPILVGLYWVGEQRALPRLDGSRLPRWLLPACLVACLCSPHHIYALTLPAELSPAVWTSDFRRDLRLANFFASSWRLAPLGQSGGYNLAAWAYFILFFMSLVSFVVRRTAVRSWRFPAWVVFALLGAWQARLAPFFAVVAAPIMAINFRGRFPEFSGIRLGRIGVVLAGLSLLLLTWPGWLQGLQRSDRPLAWTIPPDPSLQHAAQTLATWRKQGVLPADVRTLAMHPDVAHYCEWFCPGEKIFADSRLSLFLPVATDFERLCLAMNPSLHGLDDREGPSHADWEQIMSAHHIGCLSLYDPDIRVLAPALHRINQSSDQWDLLSVNGLVVFAGWKKAKLDRMPHFDADRMAFGPQETDELGLSDQASISLAPPMSWWDYYLHRSTGSSWEADAGTVYLFLFDDGIAGQLKRQRVPVLARYTAGLVGMPALPSGDIASLLGISSRFAFEDAFQTGLLERPAALPLLAVGADRKALAIHPDDAGAWFALAQSYLDLGRATTEATEFVSLPPLAQIRYLQTVTALVQALTFNPELSRAHEILARLYSEKRYFDLALRHRDIQLQLARQVGPQSEEDQESFAKRIDQLELAVEQLRILVQDNENRFVIRSYALTADPLARARIAIDFGLVGKALDEILLKSHPDLYGVEGLRLMLELMLTTGRAREAGELLARDEMQRHPDGLGWYDLAGGRQTGARWSYRFPAFDWFQVCQMAATGNYYGASNVLERMRTRMKLEGVTMVNRFRPGFALKLTAEIGLGSASRIVPLRLFASLENEQMSGLLLQSQFLEVERADLHVLEGMLLLERGQPTQAGQHFNRSLPLYASAKNTAPALPGLPLAQRYLERINFFAGHP